MFPRATRRGTNGFSASGFPPAEGCKVSKNARQTQACSFWGQSDRWHPIRDAIPLHSNTGGVVALRLNHRLIAVKLSGLISKHPGWNASL
jgi:hypothetical protein